MNDKKLTLKEISAQELEKIEGGRHVRRIPMLDGTADGNDRFVAGFIEEQSGLHD